MNIAFAGFRHGHIFALYKKAESNPNVNIIGAYEATEEARKTASEALGVSFNYATYADLLADPKVEVVALGDYYGIRGEMAIQALNAGKHVYADKPLCTSLEELKIIEKLSAEKNLKIGIMLDLRENGFVRPIRDLIANGELGEIHAISFGGQHPLNYGSRPWWYFEEGKHGGTINDIGIHGIDIVEHITGLKMKKVLAARTWNAFATEKPNFKDCGQFMVEMSNGAGLMADVSYASPSSCGFGLPYYWRFTIWGTKGVIEFNIHENNYRIALNGMSDLEVVNTPALDDVNGDCLQVFVDELEGRQTDINTKIALQSTRDILTVQAFADKNA